MKENGNEIKTMFWEDFSIAERFVLSAIQYTFNRAFKEWKEDYEFLTELVLVLNYKIWQYHEKDRSSRNSTIPFEEQTDQYAMENLKDEELSYFFDVTD